MTAPITKTNLELALNIREQEIFEIGGKNGI